MQTLTNSDLPLTVPMDVVTCPVCGESLVIHDVYELNTDGVITAFHAGCNAEPAFVGGDVWWGWHRRHYCAGVGWISTQVRVHQWLRENYRWRERQ